MIFRALVLGCLVFVANWANAAVIAGYNFGTGAGTLAPTASDPNVVASSFATSGTGSFVTGNPGNGFQGRGTYSGVTGAGSLANDFFSFTVTPNVSGGLSLSSLTFDVQGGGAEATGFDVRSSVTGTFVIASGTVGTGWTSVTPIDLTGAAFQGLSSITFQIYGTDSSAGNTRDLRVDNVTLNGTAVVPEPVNVALVIFGIAMTGTVAGRRFLARKARD